MSAALSWLGDPWIDGRWCVGRAVDALAIIDPTSGGLLGLVSQPDRAQVHDAVRAATDAFEGIWRRTSGSQRATVLRCIADGLRTERDMLAQLEAANNGKPLREAQWDIDDAAGCFDYYAGLAAALPAQQGQPLELPSADFETRIFQEPVGVAAGVVPWNYPLLMAAWKVAPALAAGCCMVLKPSELTPCTALHLARIAHAAGLPAGVLNVLPGDGSVGAALVGHPGVHKIAFTGSLDTGRQVMRSAADRIANVTLELGGKSALLIFEDVDIDAAVEWTMFGIFWNKGEVCSATSRVMVHERLADAYLERLTQACSRMHVGGPFEPGVQMGPLVAERQYKRVMAFIDEARDRGLAPLVGGRRPPGRDAGWFLEPTVYADVPLDSRLWREEIFGPVLCVRRFADEAVAVQEANDTLFGLAGAVMTADTARAERVARALRAGIVWIDCSQPTFTEAPWGGMRASGIGRELGPWGLAAYLEIKQVTRYVAKRPWGWFLKQESTA